MKRIILLLLFLSAFGMTNSMVSNEELNWQSWNQGFPKAAAEGKIALIDTYTAWCGWCKKMDADTYADPEIVAKINRHFIPIKFNPELEGGYNVGDTVISGRDLLGALSRGKSSGYPTTFFYVPNQNVMYQFPGYMNPESFHKVLDEMILNNSSVVRPKSDATPN